VSRSDILRRQMDVLAAELARVESLPKDDWPVGTVIAFDKTFGGLKGSTVYRYTAVKYADSYRDLPGYWSLTGRDGNHVRLSWEQVLDFVSERENSKTMPVIWRATHFEEVL
jgi:hypothetical protein